LGVGAVGVKEGKKLEICNSDGTLSAANMGEDARRSLGITRRMSLTWEESMKAFGSDDLLRNVLGEELVDKYMAVNEVSYRRGGSVA
jgi:glutamine synthetase